MQNFNTTSMPVRTVDALNFSEITIHNFNKSPKIEIALFPMDRAEGNLVDI